MGDWRKYNFGSTVKEYVQGHTNVRVREDGWMHNRIVQNWQKMYSASWRTIWCVTTHLVYVVHNGCVLSQFWALIHSASWRTIWCVTTHLVYVVCNGCGLSQILILHSRASWCTIWCVMTLGCVILPESNWHSCVVTHHMVRHAARVIKAVFWQFLIHTIWCVQDVSFGCPYPMRYK